ncbi:hypothetical protein SLEP1_g41116 [Rubroshorea leprosula]|uniref:Uncharacterized protein n=1 Tax=Rubroshorea leprosula TaxID=152421 RepID=A0AAV5L5H6_9ROSI|nr:hypothetical protein SLEP1_g41116 [Rubroshorea leprosula]
MWGLELSLKPDFFRSAALPSLSVTCSWLGENESSVLGSETEDGESKGSDELEG